MLLKKLFRGAASPAISREQNEAADRLRDAGDRARDTKQFAEAAQAYASYLELRPGDFGIWVQLGNCHKDAGHFAEAQAAYESALELNANDADLCLQLGHLMKRKGDSAAAIDYYRKSLKLDPASEFAATELEAFGVKIKANSAPVKILADRPATCIDITDLLWFLDFHNRVTGIQRVVSCISQQLLLGANDDGFGWVNDKNELIALVYFDSNSRTIHALRNSAAKRLLTSVLNENPPQRVIADLLEQVHRSKVKYEPKSGDKYLILGAFWASDDYSPALLRMKSRNVAIGVYIYDLIPFTHPQFVTASTRQDVVDKFIDVLSLADFVLTISDYVAQEVKGVLQAELKRQPPIFAVPLSHELPEVGDESEELDADFVDSLPREYVLCVGTVEGRKNPLLLLHAWSSLNRKHDGKIPHLVLVGKWGWDIDDFRAELASLHHVDGKIVILNNLSDTELKYLYQNCLFTIFPSFAEGWGLPVGESLAYGKPCIASNATSIPEVGGDFCRYISPYDPLSAMNEIERVLNDRDDLRQWTQRVATDFKVRSWAEVAANFLDKVDVAAGQAASPKRRAAVNLDAGHVYELTRQASGHVANAAWSDRAVKFVFSEGWRPLESWGAWSSHRTAKIEFGTNLANVKIRLLLRLRLPPPNSADAITLKDGAGRETSVFFRDGKPKWARVDCETDAEGFVRIELDRRGQIKQEDPSREIYCGLSAIAYHPSDDIGARLDILESLLLTPS